MVVVANSLQQLRPTSDIYRVLAGKTAIIGSQLAAMAIFQSASVTSGQQREVEPPATPKIGRLAYLDALRAIAILAVIAFHLGKDWGLNSAGAPLMPYGGAIAENNVVRFGHYGVELFFIISGFVIALSLERCVGWRDFAVRRFARLWPALILCTFLTWMVTNLLASAETPGPPLVDSIPAITLVPPTFWHLLGWGSAGYMDPSLWSLWVEILFYALAAALYFNNRAKFLRRLMISACVMWVVRMAAVSYALSSTAQANGSSEWVSNAIALFPLSEFIWWFVFGAALYSLKIKRDKKLAAFTAGLAVIAQLSASLHSYPARYETPRQTITMALIVFALFVTVAFIPLISRVFSWRPLTKFGEGSYSSYLIHQGIGLALIAALARWLHLSGTASLVLVPVVAALVIVFGTYLQHAWEKPAQRWVLKRFAPRQSAPKQRDPAAPEPTSIAPNSPSPESTSADTASIPRAC